MTGERILVVDDAPQAREFAADYVLRPNGFEVVLARDYIVKPYQVEEMLAAIDHALTEVRLKRERDDLVARLLESNRSLEARVRELNALYGIGKSVTALLDHEGLLHRIVEATQFVTGAQSACIHLLDGDGRHLSTAAIRGACEDDVRAPVEMMARVVVHTIQPAASGMGIVVPLLVGGRLIGTLDIANRAGAGRPLTDHDKHLLQALGDYAAIAIENARLFRELEASKEREKEHVKRLFERYVAPQVKILNYHFDLAARAVLAEEGTLDKFMGDAVLAFFNAPLIQPDHALRAARAALAMQRSIVQESSRLPQAARLSFGIGIATGEAVVGNIGSSRLMN